MKEGWMKNDEGWMMMISSCGGVFGFADEQTDKQTFVTVELLSQLKKDMYFKAYVNVHA